MKRKGFTVKPRQRRAKQEAGFIPILIAVIVTAVALGGAFILWRTVTFNKTQPQNQIVTSTTTNVSPATTQPSPTPTPSPVQAETANWKTYTNTKVGFSIKYPSDLPNPALPSGLGPTLYAIGADDDTDIIFGEKTGTGFDIIVFPFSGTLDNLLTSLQDTGRAGSIGGVDKPQSLIKTSTLNGITAKWYKLSETTCPNHTGVYLLGKNHAFVLGFCDKRADQILSTFKFTQ